MSKINNFLQKLENDKDFSERYYLEEEFYDGFPESSELKIPVQIESNRIKYCWFFNNINNGQI